MSNKELKPCPFCGGDVSMRYYNALINPYYIIDCSDCSMGHATDKSQFDLAKQRNNRPVDELLEDKLRIKTNVAQARGDQIKGLHIRLRLSKEGNRRLSIDNAALRGLNVDLSGQLSHQIELTEYAERVAFRDFRPFKVVLEKADPK